MKDLKGLRYLARLIAHPGHDWHALDLVADTVGVPAAGAGADDRLLDADVQVGRPSDAGELLDAPARTAYRKRIAALRASMEEAHSRGDASAEDQAEEELRFLTRELAAAVGLGHRPRRAGDTAERARLSVTKAIKAAIARVEDHSPALGAHLRATVRTGTYCSYTPPGDGFSWQL